MELNQKQLVEILLRTGKFKKENKELITYLLFEADNESAFIKSACDEMDALFSEVNYSNLYYTKKSIRKILRGINKYIKYSGLKQTEVELLIYFLGKIKEHRIAIHKSQTLSNLYERQLIRIEKALAKMHEDLQYDYKVEVERFR